MNFNKCVRCGCFFTSDSDVCPKCTPKDTLELATIKGYLKEAEHDIDSIPELSIQTGISVKNLHRYMDKGILNSPIKEQYYTDSITTL